MTLFRYILVLWAAITMAALAFWAIPEANPILKVVHAFGIALPFALIPLIWSRTKPPEDRQFIIPDYKVPSIIAPMIWLAVTVGHFYH